MTNYHYMTSNNKISMIFDKIQSAAQPSKFTYEVLKNMGFTSSNDRGFINVLKNLQFLNAEGIPTSYYAYLRDPSKAKMIIANQIKEYYKELFSINVNMNSASEDEIKGAISRVTGKEVKDVKRMYSTFKALCQYADFSNLYAENEESIKEKNKQASMEQEIESIHVSPDFHYNIQIHLPATTDISVYNAIFKSIKENLFK